MPISNELKNLASAREGDSQSFNALVEPYRKPLLVHCYRMSGTLDDAEDLVQETFLRAWKKIASFQEKGSFRNWLYVIATRVWLDEHRRRKKRVLLPLNGDPADPEIPPQPSASASTWLDPLPGTWLSSNEPSPEITHDRRETISLAFSIALQRLNPRQRVVLILREVYGWSAKEVAGYLEISVDSVNNLLYRARKNLKTSEAGDYRTADTQLELFVDAWERGDIESLIQHLHQEASFAMPPMDVWYSGRASIRRALRNFVFVPGSQWKLVPTTANGQSAFGIYKYETGQYHAFGLLVVGFQEGKIMHLYAFLSPNLISRFDLPLRI